MIKVTVTFPEVVETYELDMTEEEFLEGPEDALDVYVSDVEYNYEWEIEND